MPLNPYLLLKPIMPSDWLQIMTLKMPRVSIWQERSGSWKDPSHTNLSQKQYVSYAKNISSVGSYCYRKSVFTVWLVMNSIILQCDRCMFVQYETAVWDFFIFCYGTQVTVKIFFHFTRDCKTVYSPWHVPLSHMNFKQMESEQ